jgi:uncharacterized protein YbjT (DUF2867 family)
MILVVGPTGVLGSEICSLLAKKGIPMRVLVRYTSDPHKLEMLKNYGSAIILGDLHDPASLEFACKGIQGIICTATALGSYHESVNDFQSVDFEGIERLIDTAVKLEVPRFIFLSFSSSLDLNFPLLSIKRSVEKHLSESPLVFTILRSSFFMETWFSPIAGFDPVRAQAIIYGDGTNPTHWISCKNVAQFAVASLYNPSTFNSTVDLVGPEGLSPLQVVSIFEKTGQTKFNLKHIPLKTLQASLQDATDPFRKSWLSLLLCYARGESVEIPLCPIPFPTQLISVQDYSAAFYDSQKNNLNYPTSAGVDLNRIFPSLAIPAIK